MFSKERSKLMDHLICHVCLDTIKNPKLCPACSKMFCFPCIRQCFLTSKKCPHCRRYVSDINKFINCPWVEQLAEEIGNAETLTTCITHPGEQLSLYCNDCEIVICSNCVLFGHDHINHEISSFKDVCQHNQAKATEIKNYLEEKLKKLLDIQKALHGSYIKFTKTRDKFFQHMDKTTSESLMLLYNSGKIKYSSRNQILQQEIDIFNVALHELKEVTKEPMAVDSLKTIEETLAKLSLLQESDTSKEIKYKAFEVSPSLVLENAMKFGPAFSKTAVCLHDFSHLSQHDQVIHSSSLNFCHLNFKLEVHTGGLETDEFSHKQVVSLFVILIGSKAVAENSIFDFCVEIVAVNQFDNEQANKKCTFLAQFGSNQPTAVPVPDFILKLDHYGYVKQDIDCLVLRFSMRPISYQTLSKIQEDYITELEKDCIDKGGGVSISPLKAESPSQDFNGKGILGKAMQVASKLTFSNSLLVFIGLSYFLNHIL